MSGISTVPSNAFNWNNFNSGFWNNNWNQFNWQQPVWGSFTSSSGTSSSAASSSGSSTKQMTFEELVKEEKLLEKKNEILEEYKLSEKKAEAEKSKKQIEAGKKSDGSSSVAAEQKNSGFLGKVGRWVSNAGTAALNIGKSLVGIEKDGSWNPKKCLKNVGITALAVGATFIPVVGPVIGYGLLAGGVAAGGVGIAKGVKKLNNAKTDKEIDEAQQEICGGAFISGTSALGLRGLGKGLRTGSSVSSTAPNASAASTAASRSSIAGKIVEGTSNFGRDITVNALKATGNAVKYDKTLIASKGGGVSGFFKAYGGKIADSWKGMYNPKTKFENKKTKIENTVNTRLDKVNQEIQQLESIGRNNGQLTTAEQQQYALLKEERYLLQQNKNEMNMYFGTRGRSKQEYSALKENNAGTKAIQRIQNRTASANPHRVQGKEIPLEKLNGFYSRIEKAQTRYDKALRDLVKAKNDKMRVLAKNPENNKTALDEYLPTRDVDFKWYKKSTWFKNEYQRAIGGKTESAVMKTAKTAAVSPAFVTGVSFDKFSNGTLYSAPFGYGEDLSPEETSASLEDLENAIKSLETAEKAINEAKSEEELNAIVAELEKNSKDQSAEKTEKDEKASENDGEKEEKAEK